MSSFSVMNVTFWDVGYAIWGTSYKITTPANVLRKQRNTQHISRTLLAQDGDL